MSKPQIHLFRSLVAVLAVAGLLTACTSLYMPRPGPRISLVMQGGQVLAVRDGRTVPIGAFGGGLEEAVAGNPLAQELAAEHHFRNVMGFGLAMGGAGLMAASPALLLGNGDPSDRDPVPALTLLAAGLAAYLVGLGYVVSAPPYLFDAINVYNDGVTLLPGEVTPGGS